MNRDPFYRHIVDALAETLDGNLFEQCVCDLLRDVYPGLVPIPGGHDAGMDGAIVDLEGEPYPLVATTSSDVRRNFRNSLDRYKEEGGLRRQVVVATSQDLTPTRIRNLRDDARARDFTLVGYHTRADIANRLYVSPRWCKDLLGIVGDPEPLSAVSDSRRPRLSSAVIGRSDDHEWLLGLTEDAVMSGVPGCGKTFVMEELATKGDGLFLVSDDPTRVAEGIRSQQPTRILVDDAHFRLQDLTMLRRLREELGITFVIIASCWPGRIEEVTRELAIPQTRSTLRELRLLTKAEIADVVHSCEIPVRDALLRELRLVAVRGG